VTTIEQYKSGWVPKASKMAVDLMRSTQGPILETDHGKMIHEQIRSFAPLRINEKQALSFIHKARLCAAGERSCRCGYEDVPSYNRESYWLFYEVVNDWNRVSAYPRQDLISPDS